MVTLPQTPEELLGVLKPPLEFLKQVGIDVNLQTNVHTSGVFPWLENLWMRAREFVETGDVASILGGLWELMKELLNMAVGFFETLVELLRNLIGLL